MPSLARRSSAVVVFVVMTKAPARQDSATSGFSRSRGAALGPLKQIPFCREIFAKLTVGKRSADLLFPPARVFDGVGVERFIGSPVRLAIRLVISGKIYTSGCNPTDGR